MKKAFKTIMLMVIGAVCICSFGLLTGCNQSDSKEKVSLVLIGGGHSCMPVFSTECSAINDNLYQCARTYGTVTMINCDGSPKVYFQTTVPEPSVSGLSENKQKRIAENYVSQMKTAYNKSSGAVVPEVDTLKAIILGGRALQDSSGRRVLVIVDSGLQTIGCLNYTNDLLYVLPDEIVEALEQMQSLPTLRGVQVIWIGCGDTIAPQEELSEKQKTNLKEIWKKILYASGAEEVVFDGGFSTNTMYEDVPNVTTVKVETPEINIDVQNINQNPSVQLTGYNNLIDTVILDSTRLEFVGDQSVFMDENQAREILAGVADNLLDHPDNSVYIIGTTAGNDTNEFTQNLSEARASRVRELLIQMGVPADRMTAKGLGSGDPYHEYDLDENGNMIEEIARRNRKTIIMDVNSAEALLLP